MEAEVGPEEGGSPSQVLPVEPTDSRDLKVVELPLTWRLRWPWRGLGPLGGDIFYMYVANVFLYTSLKYTLPYYFSDYDGWTVYYIKVAITYVYINIVTNWLCTKCYTSFIRVTRDRPDKEEDIAIRLNAEGNDKKQLKWRFCDICEMNIPPRAHHCKVCKRCVLKRDHHCFVLGVCIGYWNQRFFFVLSFWMLVGCTLGEFFTCIYLKDNILELSGSYFDLFFPVTLYSWVCGYVSLDVVLTVSMAYLLFLGILRSINFFNVQLLVITNGKTSHEEWKHVPVRVRTGVSDNLHSVFGPFWALNFLFPAHILFQQPGDGTRWDGVSIS